MFDRFPSAADAFQLVFPPSCPSCEQELESLAQHEGESKPPDDVWNRDHWCPYCRWQLDARDSFRCEKCSAVLRQASPYAGRCASCLGAKLPFDSSVSVHNYDGLLKQLVIRAKNQRDDTLTAQLGRLLGQRLLDSPQCSKIDLVAPVPSHWKRQLKTGFHAANLISKNVAKITGITESQRVLESIKATRKQGTLTRTARLSNIRNAFRCRFPEKVADRTILLVDDVMTSGATTAEASRVLLKAGAKRIVVAVVARATGIG